MAPKTSRSKTPARNATPRTTQAERRSGRTAKDAYVEGVIVRGEAVEPAKDGSIPGHATHVKKRGPDGQTTIARVRFKLA